MTYRFICLPKLILIFFYIYIFFSISSLLEITFHWLMWLFSQSSLFSSALGKFLNNQRSASFWRKIMWGKKKQHFSFLFVVYVRRNSLNWQLTITLWRRDPASKLPGLLPGTKVQEWTHWRTSEPLSTSASYITTSSAVEVLKFFTLRRIKSIFLFCIRWFFRYLCVIYSTEDALLCCEQNINK